MVSNPAPCQLPEGVLRGGSWPSISNVRAVCAQGASMASIAPLDASSAANVAGASRGLGDQQAASNNRQLVTSIATVFCFVGFTMSINGIGAPWIAKSFHLGESGIASLFAWISFSAIGALA